MWYGHFPWDVDVRLCRCSVLYTPFFVCVLMNECWELRLRASSCGDESPEVKTNTLWTSDKFAVLKSMSVHRLFLRQNFLSMLHWNSTIFSLQDVGKCDLLVLDPQSSSSIRVPGGLTASRRGASLPAEGALRSMDNRTNRPGKTASHSAGSRDHGYHKPSALWVKRFHIRTADQYRWYLL